MPFIKTIKNQKYKYFYLIALVLLAIYLYFSYSNIMKKNESIYTNELINYYKIYLKTFQKKSIKDFISIENSKYVNNFELIEELSKSTPIYMNKEKKLNHPYNIVFNFYKESLLLNELKDQEYIINKKNNSYILIGKVKSLGYVEIIRYINNNDLHENDIKDFFKDALILVFINILFFFYFLHSTKKANEHEIYLDNEYKKLQEDTTKLAFEDTLTKAATRLKFNESLNDLMEIANRFEDQKFALTIFDIDNFKSVNDEHGHDYGDFILKTIAYLVKKRIRKIDLFARWGGEEFVILSPLTKKMDAVNMANRIRVDIENYNFSKLDQVTCSFGLVEFEKTDTEESILKRADVLLYKAKKSGKNKVVYEG